MRWCCFVLLFCEVRICWCGNALGHWSGGCDRLEDGLKVRSNPAGPFVFVGLPLVLGFECGSGSTCLGCVCACPFV